jgi:hypothetical protein
VNHYSLTLVPDSALLRELRALVAQDRATTATLLAHLAEVDARRLYAPAGHPSMFAYCVAELRLSADLVRGGSVQAHPGSPGGSAVPGRVRPGS